MILSIAVLVVVLILAGSIDGMVEGFEFDSRMSFERKYKVDELSFWGSKSHKRITLNPNLYNKLLGVFDFYHVADDLRKTFYLISGILMCCIEWDIIPVFLLSFIISGLAKKYAMKWIRD